MKLTPAQEELVERLGANVEHGLTSDEATKRREHDGVFNVVKPPVDCPAWICCLLPCIKNIPSMKAFKSCQPDDAEVLRNGKWIRYDAASLVRGDVIRLEEGDIVPADCVVLCNDGNADDHSSELLVDVRAVAGVEALRSFPGGTEIAPTMPLLQLYYGGHVVQGCATAVITEIGPNTHLGTLIREGNFPPKGNTVSTANGEDGDGISLMSRNMT
jgi:E1-E2 ATPase/Cation transporter/ATPase, N-terminus